MHKISLPDVKDIAGIAADYFDSVVEKRLSPTERARIIEESIPPLLLVIEAARMAGEGDQIGFHIFVAFMRDIALQTGSFASEDVNRAH